MTKLFYPAFDDMARRFRDYKVNRIKMLPQKPPAWDVQQTAYAWKEDDGYGLAYGDLVIQVSADELALLDSSIFSSWDCPYCQQGCPYCQQVNY